MQADGAVGRSREHKPGEFEWWRLVVAVSPTASSNPSFVIFVTFVVET